MKAICTFVLSALFFMASAQRVSIESLKGWKPRNIGPAGMSGRVTAIDVIVAQPNTWYIGAASGGVWKTENSGAS